MGAERCPRCREELPPGARFCAYCGVALELTPARVAPREERRVITALFADLAGSTQLGEKLDPEDFRDLTAGALAIMGASIEELGGTIRGTAGDGVLGLFGAPVAHEDDAERAVIAGLRIVSSMNAYGAEASRRWNLAGLHVRIGIETGLAVLGEVRAGTQVQYDASGDCLNTAARLEGAADLDGVLVGPTTHRLLGDAFNWGQPRPLALKGKADPVVACHAVSRGERGRQEAGVGSRLVGREHELAAAGQLAADVRAGATRTTFVTGQAGIGKTRFVGEFRALFLGGAPSSVWLEGTCLSYGLDEPYLPFRQILRQALGVGADSSSGIHEAVAAVLGPERAAEAAPMLGLVLGLPPASADAARITSLSGESLQQAVTAAVAELMTGLAERGPVAVVVDDFHWADAASLRLTEGLVDELGEEAPVLVLVAMRPESDRAGWALRDRMLRRRPERTAELSLSSLDHDDVRDLVSDLVGEGTLPAELEATLL
ncbi:MAG: AAA family ATPase, partial [Marmoricola sp.]